MRRNRLNYLSQHAAFVSVSCVWEVPRTAQSWQGSTKRRVALTRKRWKEDGKKFFLVKKGGEKGKWEKVIENYWKIVEQEKKREKGWGKKEGKDWKEWEKKGERGENGRRKRGEREGWETLKTTGAPEISETRSFLWRPVHMQWFSWSFGQNTSKHAETQHTGLTTVLNSSKCQKNTTQTRISCPELRKGVLIRRKVSPGKVLPILKNRTLAFFLRKKSISKCRGSW